MLNAVKIQGNLTDDVRRTTTEGGSERGYFVIACDRNYGDRIADFIPCVAWNQTAVFIGNYFRRGSEIIIEGHLESSQEHGLSLVCDTVHFAGRKQKDAG